MIIQLSKDLISAVGLKELKPYGIDKDNMRWERGQDIDLSSYSVAKNNDLRQLLTPFTREGGASAPVIGAALAVRDIGIWLSAGKNAGGAKPRTVQGFYSLLKRYLLKEAPGQRVYFFDTEKNCWWCYYVGKVEYYPRYEDRSNIRPAQCRLELFYWEFGKLEYVTQTYYEDEIRGVTVAEGLRTGGYIIETPVLREAYLATLARYNENVMEVGRQFWARGTGTDDLDGNKKSRDDDRWYFSRTNTVRLDKNDEPSRVVIDVFRENDKQSRDRETHLSERFWYYVARKKVTSDGDEMDDDELEAYDDESEFAPPEVPVHPTCATFDLKRHLRLRIHIDQLTLYEYDATLGDKLVLPADERALVEILLHNKSAFADIIAGKGGGAVVMCAGAPGLGKTLTAEVYAEVTGRPLFSVQCSQLGMKPDQLEDELLKSFARAERWNAILLLDEADVYIAPRGSNLIQNAMVGVFLRTLEYYQGVLFMTTNRADLIDDAIASRCIARLNYSVPTPEAQLRIWNILSSLSGGVMKEAEARKVVKAHPALSGRDVKNLLKLGLLVARSRNQTHVTAELIEFVKRFKPTLDLP